ncbi:hypothetical protein XELAEV_18023510mg [Xenopus laevis]|uniref:SGNH hydrolase-type esterase domain-containing protein n=1 Tax=Xenopus laevis TaxID=8355 RepID=A0A974D4B3_XENLA|nr:hypothetical protein XELAEV_18023510mg [Xenopus laevis]
MTERQKTELRPGPWGLFWVETPIVTATHLFGMQTKPWGNFPIEDYRCEANTQFLQVHYGGTLIKSEKPKWALSGTRRQFFREENTMVQGTLESGALRQDTTNPKIRIHFQGKWTETVWLVQKLPEVCFSQYEITLFSLLFVFSFFAALRVRESISSNKKKTGGLDVSDVVLVQDKFRIILKKSKTDPTGKGTLIWLGSFWVESLCPMATFFKFMALRPNIPGPLIIHADGSFLSTFQYRQVLKKTLGVVGLSPKDYNTHSFRIGAATQAVLFGFSEQSLMKLGRWSSKRYRSYVRPRHPLMVWIIGHSFVFRAKKRAEKRTYGVNLGIKNVNIVWMGLRGLKWDDMLPIALQMSTWWGIPAIIFIHLGGNDIGELFYLAEVIPRFIEDARVRPLERCREKLNFCLAKFAKSVNILVHRHFELESGGGGLYWYDRVHLSDIGNYIFNMGIQDAFEKAIKVWGWPRPI